MTTLCGLLCDNLSDCDSKKSGPSGSSGIDISSTTRSEIEIEDMKAPARRTAASWAVLVFLMLMFPLPPGFAQFAELRHQWETKLISQGHVPRQSLKAYLLGEPASVVTYVTQRTPAGGYSAVAQTADKIYHSRGEFETEVMAKRSATISGLADVSAYAAKAPKNIPSKPASSRGQEIAGHFDIVASSTKVRDLLVKPETLNEIRKKTRAKVNLVEAVDGTLTIQIKGPDRRCMKAMHAISHLISQLPRKIRPKAAFHLDA